MPLNHRPQALPALAIASLLTLGAANTFAASLNYIANSSKKIEQVSGPCDWVSWDPKTTYGTPGPCGQTASQAFPSQILGTISAIRSKTPRPGSSGPFPATPSVSRAESRLARTPRAASSCRLAPRM